MGLVRVLHLLWYSGNHSGLKTKGLEFNIKAPLVFVRKGMRNYRCWAAPTCSLVRKQVFSVDITASARLNACEYARKKDVKSTLVNKSIECESKHSLLP